jgi:hypothetical protein
MFTLIIYVFAPASSRSTKSPLKFSLALVASRIQKDDSITFFFIISASSCVLTVFES